MGIFDKSEAEKDQARESKNRQQEEKEAARRRKEWLSTPIGQAASAHENGAGFFEIEIELGASNRDVSFGTSDQGKYKRNSVHTGILSEIESVGWRLEHAAYYFMTTGESSRDKFLASGQFVAVKGKTMGVYLFRRVTN